MRKALYTITTTLFVSLSFFKPSTAFSQTLRPEKFDVGKPVVVNFTQLANYERTHPVMLPKRFIEQGEDREKNFKPNYGPVPANAKKFDVSLPQIETRSVSPAPKIVFNGIQDAGYLIPPDINGAASEDYVLETTNQQFTIYKKDGSVVSTLNIVNFFSPAHGNGYYDPHVIYDALRKRFLICIDGFNPSDSSELFVAVSQTSDPTGSWYVYGIDGRVSANDLLDYPAMGYNKKWIVLTANDFQSFAVPGKIYVFDRDSVYAGKGISVSVFTDNNVFSLLPVATQDSTLENEYMILSSTSNSGGFGYVRLYSISGSAKNPVYSFISTIGVNQPWSTRGLGAPQLGSTATLEVIDTRIENGLYLNGSLWFTHNVFVPANNPTHSAVDWWQVNPVNDSVEQFGRIEDPTGSNFYFYPSIGVNKDTDVMVGYAVSSPNIFPSSGYAFRQHSDPLNTMESSITFKNGEAPYFKDFGSGRNRWGDFTFTCTDPSDNSFWTFQEFAGTSNHWGTVVANSAGIPCSGIPDVGIISTASDTICFGSEAILSLSGNSAGVAGIDYNWQQSTDGINWSAAQNGIDNTMLTTPQLFNTTFYRSIATCSNSGAADTSATQEIALQGFTQTPTSQSICSPQTVKLTAKSTNTISWFNSLYTNTPIATGDTLTANVVSDTTFYASSGSKDFHSGGVLDSSKVGNYLPDMSKGLQFTALSDFIIDSVFVYPKTTGNLTVNLLNSGGTEIVSKTIAIVDSEVGKKTPIPLFMSIPGNADYSITASNSTVKGLWFNQANVSFPYIIPGILQINKSSDGSTNWYYFFYDWHVSSGCGIERVPAYVNLDSVNLKIKATRDTLCDGGVHIDTLNVSGATSYFWQPGNINDSVLIVSPAITTTYSVTGTNAAGCFGVGQFTVFVSQCTSGINPVNVLNGIEVFPNPAQNLLNVRVGSPGDLSYSVAVNSVLGVKLINLPGVHLTSQKYLSIDISHLPSGAYYLTIENAGKRWVKSFDKF